ncbi:MAG: biotin transporter BioY [Clostridiales bacterium]|jgi:biotin transport system substrate-specific component|nr:biotin transporter BioY [Clostridiales bacterium]
MADKTQKNKTYNIVLIAVSAALITICSWISITIGPVPFTLQTMAIFAVLMTIGGARGSIAVVIYLLLGLVGVPVFAGFKGGPASFLGPTGGFLVGFAVASLVWILLEKLLRDKMSSSAVKRILYGVINAVICEVVMYTIGVIWFMVVYGQQTGPVGLGATLTMCVVPFIIPDIVKIAVAIVIGERAGKLIHK